MKQSFLLLNLAFFLLSATSIKATKPTHIKSKQVNVSYVQLPNKPIKDKKNRTYSVAAKILTYQTAYDEKTVCNDLKISELNKLEKDGFLQINFEFGSFNLTKLEKVEDKSTVKTKEGTKVVIKYYYKMSYTINATAEASTDYGKSSQGKYSSSVSKTHNTDTYSSSEALEAYYRMHSGDIQFKLKNEFIANAKKEMYEKINDDFGYQKIQKGQGIYVLKNEKHKEFIGFEDAFNNVNRVFSMMKYDVPTSTMNMEEELKGAIEFYQQILTKYTGDKRKDAKLKYAALYNLTYIYYYLDNFTKAKEYAQKMIDNKNFRDGEGKRIHKEIVQTEYVVKINDVTHRHIIP